MGLVTIGQSLSASPLTPWHGVPSVSNGHSKMAHMQDFDLRVSPDGRLSKPLPRYATVRQRTGELITPGTRNDRS